MIFKRIAALLAAAAIAAASCVSAYAETAAPETRLPGDITPRAAAGAYPLSVTLPEHECECGLPEFKLRDLTPEEKAEIDAALERDREEQADVAAPAADGKYTYASSFYYDRLATGAQKKLYRDIDDAFAEFDASYRSLSSNCFSGDITFSEDEVSKNDAERILHLYAEANPQYFYMGWSAACSSVNGVQTLYLWICDEKYRSAAKRNKDRDAIEAVTDVWIDEINACTGEIEKAYMIYEKLADHITYKIIEGNTIYRSFVEGISQCHNFALAAEYLCSAVGIDCAYVRSSTHAWNYVKLGGVWYITDVTWMNNDKAPSLLNWGWCNVSDASAARMDPHPGDHTIDMSFYEGLVGFPACSLDGPSKYTVSARSTVSSVTLSWDGRKDSGLYYVYTVDDTGHTTYLTSTAETTYTHSGLSGGAENTYRVYGSYGGYMYTLCPDKTAAAYNYIGMSCEILPEKINFTWKEVPGAEKYVLWRVVPGSGKFTKAAEIDAGQASYSYADENLIGGELYHYILYGYKGGKEYAVSDYCWLTPEVGETDIVYRLYNPVNLEHLFTTDKNEVKVLVKDYGWSYEGSAWSAPKDGAPVYRLYCELTNAHLYTADTNERDILLNSSAWSIDNNGEPLFYSPENETAIYRVYSPALQRHLLTTDKNEYDVLIGSGWNGEGVKFCCSRPGDPNYPQPV